MLWNASKTAILLERRDSGQSIERSIMLSRTIPMYDFHPILCLAQAFADIFRNHY